MTAATHNETGYTLSDACIALKLFNGNYLFADKVIFRRDQVGYLNRGEPVNGREWNWIAASAVDCITVGIYEV